MKLTFFSNFMNHHQLYISNVFYRALGDNYTFVATTPVPSERLNMGYKDINKDCPFVLTTYDNKENVKKAKELAKTSDVVIIGSADNSFIKHRLKNGKLTFKYSERLFKEGDKGIYLKVKNYLRVLKHFKQFENKNLYCLCASGYTASDVNRYADFSGKTLKWGYFPEIIYYDNIEELLGKKEPLSFLWAGRTLSWKHPETALKLIAHLKGDGYRVKLDLIGAGPLDDELKSMADELDISTCVNFLGTMSPENVRKKMESSKFFLFTSDFGEGWGAVLNEALNSGCTVLVSHAVGAAPFLVKQNENGIIFKSEDDEDLYKKAKELLDNPLKAKKLAKAAVLTMQDMWNPKTAAERFLSFSNGLLENKPVSYDNGPLSLSENLKNDWIYF